MLAEASILAYVSLLLLRKFVTLFSSDFFFFDRFCSPVTSCCNLTIKSAHVVGDILRLCLLFHKII